MAQYEDFLNEIRPNVVEAPEPEIIDIVRRIVIDFCRRSRFWRVTQTINLKQNKGSYDIRVNQGRSDQILRVQYSDNLNRSKVLAKKNYSELIVPEYNINSKTCLYYGEQNSGSIYVYPSSGLDEDADPKLIVYVVAVPSRQSSSFPDEVFEQFFDGIVAGVLWKMFGTVNKPWSDRDLSLQNKFDYDTEVNNARRKANSEAGTPQTTQLLEWV